MNTRTVVITGASGGIGLATARLFSDDGWKVIGLDQRSPSTTEGAHFADFRLVDLSDAASLERTFQRISSDRSQLDVLVCGAAYQPIGSLLALEVDQWDRVFAVNLRAAFLCSKYAHPLLVRSRAGAIVHIASVHAQATSADIAAYASSKGGLVALARASAIEFASQGIRVNAVMPGAVDTPMLRAGLERGGGGGRIDDRMRDLAAATVCGRIGDPMEIAQAVLFLADSTRSSFITGQALVVDGGATARLSTE